MPLLLVMLGGAIGAGARYLVGQAMLGWLGPGFPWWTLLINVAGGLLMGLLTGVLLRWGLGDNWRLFLGVGVLGGFTTFSSFSLEAVTLAQRGAMAAAAGYVLASVAGAIAALVAGLWLARGVA
jgi:fluoride exporter